MAANKEFLTKEVKRKLTKEAFMDFRKCDNCAVGQVVIYICPEHLEMVEK